MRGPDRDPDLPRYQPDRYRSADPQYRADDRRRPSYHFSDDGSFPPRGSAPRGHRGSDVYDRRSDRGFIQNKSWVNLDLVNQRGNNQHQGGRQAHGAIISDTAAGKENMPQGKTQSWNNGAAHDSWAIDTDGDVNMAGNGLPTRPLQRSKSVSTPTGTSLFK